MTLLTTVFAAIICTVIWYKNENARSLKVGTLVLMYWGASLMWLIDCIFSAAGGEGFFDISMEDTILGIIILAAGFAVMNVTKILPKRD